MKYQLKITRTEKNQNYEEEMKKYEEENKYSDMRFTDKREPYPQIEKITNVLLVELTENEYQKVKEAVLTVYK